MCPVSYVTSHVLHITCHQCQRPQPQTPPANYPHYAQGGFTLQLENLNVYFEKSTLHFLVMFGDSFLDFLVIIHPPTAKSIQRPWW